MKSELAHYLQKISRGSEGCRGRPPRKGPAGQKERDEALKLVEERPVVDKIEEHYVNDYSAPRVFLIGLVIGIGIGAAIVYLLPFLASLFSP